MTVIESKKNDNYSCSASPINEDTCSSQEFYFTGQDFIASWDG